MNLIYLIIFPLSCLYLPIHRSEHFMNCILLKNLNTIHLTSQKYLPSRCRTFGVKNKQTEWSTYQQLWNGDIQLSLLRSISLVFYVLRCKDSSQPYDFITFEQSQHCKRYSAEINLDITMSNWKQIC